MMTTANQVKPGDKIRLKSNSLGIDDFYSVSKTDSPMEGIIRIITPGVVFGDEPGDTWNVFPENHPVEIQRQEN